MSNAFLTRLSAILILVVIILVYALSCNSRKKDKSIDELSGVISALNDTLKTTRYSDSSSKATIKAFSTQKVQDFLSLKTKDSTINELQKVVSQYKDKLKSGGSVVLVKGETNISGNGNTIIEHTSYDTINNPVFPVYTSTITNKWYNIKTRADKDTTRVDLKVFNVYNVVVAKEKGEWVADVTNFNPYSATETARAYSIEMPKQKQKRVTVSALGGYGFNLQGQVRGTPFIGIGIGYTIISLF